MVGAATVAAAVVAGSARQGETAVDRPAGAGHSAPPLVVVPGRPGESASAMPADKVTVPDAAAYNSLDAWFVRTMIMHHAQAVQMAALAPSRARNPQIRALAERIRIAQDSEVALMRAWLQARGLDDRLGEHDHGSMRGMQSPATMRTLAAATGDGFDRMFVDRMSHHHQGAIDMATDLLKGGKSAEVERLATDVITEQTVEIARMREAIGG